MSQEQGLELVYLLLFLALDTLNVEDALRSIIPPQSCSVRIFVVSSVRVCPCQFGLRVAARFGWVATRFGNDLSLGSALFCSAAHIGSAQ